MNYKLILVCLMLFVANSVAAQTTILFKNGFEFHHEWNDTGITWAGEYPSGNNLDCSSVTITAPQDCNTGRDVTHGDMSNGHAGFNYTKLDSNGNALPASDMSHSCVMDNVTGLVWEVKSEVVGIHHRDNLYFWGGLTALGRDHPNRKGLYSDEWNVLVIGSNNDVLCGFDNWRVPTIPELTDLANNYRAYPAIDTNYFPNTVLGTTNTRYWASNPLAINENLAWIEYFSHGTNHHHNRGTTGTGSHVRLVTRGGL